MKLDFLENYNKLRHRVLIDIRGASRIKTVKVGKVVELSYRGKVFGKAEVIRTELMRVADIPLPLMQACLNSPYNNVRDCWHFIELMNNNRPYKKIKDLHDQLTVIKLKRIEETK